jgi:hypothetical protein
MSWDNDSCTQQANRYKVCKNVVTLICHVDADCGSSHVLEQFAWWASASFFSSLCANAITLPQAMTRYKLCPLQHLDVIVTFIMIQF